MDGNTNEWTKMHEPELSLLPNESVVVAAILSAVNEPEKAVETLKLWRAAAEGVVRTDALNGFPSLEAAPEERQSYVFACSAARWLRAIRRLSFDEATAYVACELARGTSDLARGINRAIADAFMQTFKPETDQVEAALDELARGVVKALREQPGDDHAAAIKKVLRAARNIEPRAPKEPGQYL